MKTRTALGQSEQSESTSISATVLAKNKVFRSDSPIGISHHKTGALPVSLVPQALIGRSPNNSKLFATRGRMEESSAPSRLASSPANTQGTGILPQHPAHNRLPLLDTVRSLGIDSSLHDPSSCLFQSSGQRDFVLHSSRTRPVLSRSGLIAILDQAIRMIDDDLAQDDQLLSGAGNPRTNRHSSSFRRRDASPQQQ